MQRSGKLRAIEAPTQIRQQVHMIHGQDLGTLLLDARAERDDDIERMWHMVKK
ncbi:MAG: hypothetical protein GWP61_27990 [Chloroflexi bacterium]|nr:hypothetical protein [Chloroflexota bacterium]